ncbi:MAG: GNAT family N-acetyltransferase, partial [Thermoanaerobaculia bacterium]|nr:GNAT family N-acetyltransferase [Thermoanaerobaculia bacterium]
TTDDGSQSRIRPSLLEGEGATIARSDVHYVVTEYGFAYLFGRSIEERALALIEIAHPKFREDLLENAKRLAYVGKDTSLKSRSAYPTDREKQATLRNGETILLRPTRASDRELIQELFYSLSPDDIYTRFFTNLRSLSDSKAQHLCSVSYEDEMAFIAVTGTDQSERVVGSCCYYVNQSTNLADVAYMIHPEWQGLGLGSAMQETLISFARSKGVRGFTADVLCQNEKMLRVFEKSGCRINKTVVSGSFEVEMLFGEEAE